jgi:hypothetical protein
MQHETETRAIWRVRALRGIQIAAPWVIAVISLAACAEDSPVAPKANVPQNGPKTVALGVNKILPDGQQFPAKIAYLTGSPVGQPAKIQVYDAYGNQMLRFTAFADAWDNASGVEATIGDVTGDGWPDIIAGEGPALDSPNGSRLSVWDGKTGVLIESQFSLNLKHKGGLRVGAGDINADGKDEIFTCFGMSSEATRMDVLTYNPGVPNIGYVKTSTTLGLLTGQNTFDGCRVAGGDVSGDGKDETVIFFDGSNNALLVIDWTGKTGYTLRKKPLGTAYNGAASVAVGDRYGDGKADVFLGRLSANDQYPSVRIFDGAALLSQSTLPYPTYQFPISTGGPTGVWVAVRDLNGDGIPELLAKPTLQWSMSTYVGKSGPAFTTFWLNRTEPGNIIAGGMIG